MTAVPRVRVRRDIGWFPALRPWYAHCPWCGPIGAMHLSWDGAMWEAGQHAADPCEGIRLARLVAELEKLREHWTEECREWIDSATESDKSTDLTRGFRIGAGCGISYVVGDLDRLIKETNR